MPFFILSLEEIDVQTREKILERLHQIHPLNRGDQEALKQLFEQIDLPKNGFLIREGERAQFCYFQLSGVSRVYYNNDGKEYNKTFFVPGMFPTPITSLISDSPSKVSCQAITPSSYIRFHYKSFRKLFEKHRGLESLLLRIMELEWIKKEDHDIRMVTNDAQTNYLIFRERFPGLENHIPQYHIASYLGITPIQLSRVRASLAQKPE